MLGDLPGDHVEEELLDPGRDRSARALAYRAPVELADRSDLGRRAGEEGFVGDVDVVAGQTPRLDSQPEIARERDDRIAGDADQRRSKLGLVEFSVLDDEQIAVLRDELAELIDPNHPAHDLFYEFHSNESTNPLTVLFHALGAWRIKPGFHDLLWNPAVLMPASQLLGGAVRGRGVRPSGLVPLAAPGARCDRVGRGARRPIRPGAGHPGGHRGPPRRRPLA